jgi:FKBP-type peptidyl-prolyl cis-trans isomerase FklB
MVKIFTRNTLAAMCVAGTTVFTATVAAQDMTLKSHDDKQSYALGMIFGQQIVGNLAQANAEINHDILLRALSDTITQQETLMSVEELQTFLQAEQQKQIEVAQDVAAQSAEAGALFLAEYEKKDGVQKTQSGILYQELEAGDGEMPSASDTVKVHYKGTLKDGAEFDSSYARGTPAEFPVNGVIQGWQEVLPMMKTGAKWEIAIPSDLAYGEQGAGANIGPNEPLVFIIELIEII